MFLNRLSQSLFLSFFLLISFFVSSETLTTYYHTDVLGSAVAASDEKKRVLWQEAYQPFGKKRIDDDNENRIGFTGHVYDDELNLVYMQARFYDPLLGRFMGVDPIGVDTNNPHSFNRYAYANNNPYRFVDPDGNIPVDYLIDGISLSLSAAIFANDPSVVNGLALFGDTVLAALPYVPAGIGIVRSGDKVVVVARSADSSISGLKLQKQLASQEQLSQLSKGGGTVISQPAKQADRIAAQTGRNPANIQKVSSDVKPLRDGSKIETHSFRDASTNELIEPKTIIGK